MNASGGMNGKILQAFRQRLKLSWCPWRERKKLQRTRNPALLILASRTSKVGTFHRCRLARRSILRSTRWKGARKCGSQYRVAFSNSCNVATSYEVAWRGFPWQRQIQPPMRVTIHGTMGQDCLAGCECLQSRYMNDHSGTLDNDPLSRAHYPRWIWGRMNHGLVGTSHGATRPERG
jgi:hypothetical protein